MLEPRVSQAKTTGSDAAQIAVIRLGVAAHITAAATGGPRFDPDLTTGKRRNESNGIWLCQNCAKLIDSDPRHFSVELLLTWKETAQKQSFRDAMIPAPGPRKRLQLDVPAAGDSIEALIYRRQAAATTDLAGFQRRATWPRHVVTLNLRIRGEKSLHSRSSAFPRSLKLRLRFVSWRRRALAKQPRCFNSAEALLQGARAVAIFVPLGEWAALDGGLIAGCAPVRRSEK